MKSNFVLLLLIPFTSCFLTGCLINSSSYKTTSRIIIDCPTGTGYHITMTNTQTNQTVTLPHTLTLPKQEQLIVFNESTSPTVPPTLRIGDDTYRIDSEYITPLKAFNRTTKEHSTSGGSFAVPFIIGASSKTTEYTDYIYLAPTDTQDNTTTDEHQ
ncbi:hypothetical protein [Poriferisphaera sp. WC338]|uniref:hypothetical protein n=1 Tax=Poriferisphaera sp. WC338 TaxID=3425129 RepID=UPI003D8196C1